MPVQVTPYKGSNLSQLTAQGAQLNNQREGLRLQDVALQQRGEHQQFQREAATQQMGQAQQRIQQAAEKIGLDAAKTEAEMIILARENALKQNPQATPEQLKTQAQANFGIMVNDPDYAAQRFANAPDAAFQVSRSNADLRAEASEKRADEGLILRREGLDLQRQQIAATTANDTLKSESAAAKAAADASKAELSLSKARQEAESAERQQETAVLQRNRASRTVAGLLSNKSAADLDSTYGSLQGMTPTALQSQAQKDMRARIRGLESWIAIEERAKLKGQGTITDTETLMLKESVSILSDFTISESLAREELREVAAIMGLEIPEESSSGGRQVGQGRNQVPGSGDAQIAPGVSISFDDET